MNRLTQRIAQWGLLVMLVLASMVSRADIKSVLPEPSNPPRLVNDFAHFMQPEQIEALERKLRLFNDSTSNQVAIITIPSLEEYDIEEYGNELFRKWKIGQAKKNNGVLLLASKEDRKVKIEVGYGLEGALPDAICNQIIDLSIVPNFKAGNFYQGFDKATDDIIAATKNEYKADAVAGKGGGGGIFTALFLFLIIMFFIMRLSRKSRTFMSRRGSRNWDDWGGGGPWIGGGGFGGGGWGGGSSGGGGFGGFGGGSSGGGGASGSW